jgi:hypothetical protein
MLDLNDILKPPPGPALHPQADNDQPDMERMVAFLTQMQAGVDMLTSILAAQKQEIEKLKTRCARLEAQTPPTPKRSSILRV